MKTKLEIPSSFTSPLSNSISQAEIKSEETGFSGLVTDGDSSEFIPEHIIEFNPVVPLEQEVPIIAEEAAALIVKNLVESPNFLDTLATILTEKISNQLDMIDQVNYSRKFNKSSSALLNLKQELFNFVEVLNLEVTNNINSIANNVFLKVQNV